MDVYNGSTEGEHLTSVINFNVRRYWEDGDWYDESRQGTFFTLTVPGHGHLLFQAGRVKRTRDGEIYFEAGKNLDFDTAPVCDYLR